MVPWTLLQYGRERLPCRCGRSKYWRLNYFLWFTSWSWCSQTNQQWRGKVSNQRPWQKASGTPLTPPPGCVVMFKCLCKSTWEEVELPCTIQHHKLLWLPKHSQYLWVKGAATELVVPGGIEDITASRWPSYFMWCQCAIVPVMDKHLFQLADT